MNTVLLRPHHGLCIRFFEGKGYSEEFIKHMTQIISRLEENTEICITTGCDSVCSMCPNYDGTRCDSEERVMAFDKRVMEFAKIFDKQRLTYKELQRKIEDGIFAPGRFEQVCGDCAWGEICHKNSVKTSC